MRTGRPVRVRNQYQEVIGMRRSMRTAAAATCALVALTATGGCISSDKLTPVPEISVAVSATPLPAFAHCVVESFEAPQQGVAVVAQTALYAEPTGSFPVGWLEYGDGFTATERRRCSEGTFLLVSARVRGLATGSPLSATPVQGAIPVAGSTSLG
jgi:hypothetical protein